MPRRPPPDAHAAQARLFARVDAASLAVDRAVAGAWRALLAVLRDPGGRAHAYGRALAVLRAVPAVIAGAMRDRLSRLVVYGHGQAVRTLTGGLHGRGARLRPVVVRVGSQRAAPRDVLGEGLAAGQLLRAGLPALQLTEDEGAPDPLADLFPAPSLDAVARILAPFVRPADWQQIGTDAHRRMPEDLAAQIAASMAQGKTHREVAKDIQPLLDGSRVRAVRAARTFGLHAAHAGQRAAWDQAGDLIAGFTVHATFHNTRPEHAARDGTTYWKNPRPGQKGMDECPRPPLEADGSIAWNCACWLTPVLSP